MTWTPFEPRRIDGQKRPWGIAHLVDGVPHFHKVNGHLQRFLTSAAALEAAEEINAEIRERFNNFMDGITPPEKASYGTLRWPVQLVDYPVIDGYSFINIDRSRYRGKDILSLTGIPWSLSAADAHIVAQALINAARWLERHPNPYLTERK